MLVDEQRKWFLEVEPTPGEDAVKLIEMTTRYGNITSTYLIKQQQNLRELTVILKKVDWLKYYQAALHAPEELFMKGRVDHFGKFYYCLILRNCHSHLKPLATTSLISQQSST